MMYANGKIDNKCKYDITSRCYLLNTQIQSEMKLFFCPKIHVNTSKGTLTQGCNDRIIHYYCSKCDTPAILCQLQVKGYGRREVTPVSSNFHFTNKDIL